MAKRRVFKSKPGASSVRGDNPAGNAPDEDAESMHDAEDEDLDERVVIHDEAPPGGRYIVGGREVNARGLPFSDNPDINLAPDRSELETEVDE